MKSYYWILIVVLLGILAFVFWPKGERSWVLSERTQTSFEKYAQELGLDTEKFEACLTSGKYEEAVKKDYQEGVKVGVTATPTIFINNNKIVGTQSFEEVRKVIEEELDRSKKQEVRSKEETTVALQIASGGAAVKGLDDAKVVIDEFSDYQCPYCASFAKNTVSQIFQQYADKVKYIFHDFPLPFHKNAQKAAEAARCAGEQDKYWEYHNLLFEKQSEWGKQ